MDGLSSGRRSLCTEPACSIRSPCWEHPANRQAFGPKGALERKMSIGAWFHVEQARNGEAEAATSVEPYSDLSSFHLVARGEHRHQAIQFGIGAQLKGPAVGTSGIGQRWAAAAMPSTIVTLYLRHRIAKAHPQVLVDLGMVGLRVQLSTSEQNIGRGL